MIFKKVQGKVDWKKIAQIVENDDVCLSFGNYKLVIKRTTDFRVKIETTVEYLTQFSPTNWFLFIYNADFSNINIINAKSVKLDSNSSSDIILYGNTGLVLQTLEYIHLRFKGPIDNEEIYKNIKQCNTPMSLSQVHTMQLSLAGEKARNYLSHVVSGKYLFDISSNIIPGVALTFRDGNAQNKSYGYGRAFKFKDAFDIAALEAVERFVSQFYAYDCKDQTILATYNELKSKAYSPEVFVLEENSKINNDSKLYWTKAQSLIDGSSIWIPEDLAVYGNNAYRRNYIRKIHDSSNGVSLGGSYSEATIGALLELIERHSFLATWFGKIPGQKIFNFKRNLNSEMHYAVTRLEREGYQIELFEISVISPVYVVWCLIRNNKANANMFSYSAAGSGLMLSEAVNAALKEALVGMSVYSNNQKSMPKVPEKLKTLEDHVRYYGNSSTKKAFDFTKNFSGFVDDKRYLTFGKEPTSVSRNKVVEVIISQLEKCFKDILIVNLTSAYLRKHSLYAVKAVVPGMFPMTFGDKSLRINLEDINRLRAKRGLSNLEKFENIPHPFP